MQALDLLLFQGESVFTEVGGMAWYRGHIKMETNMPGGLMGGLGRMVSGESLFFTTYTCLGEQAEVTFTPESPGAIVHIDLAQGESVIAQRDSFMCAYQGVQLAVHFKQRLGVGLFGGEGLMARYASWSLPPGKCCTSIRVTLPCSTPR
jgi:uncharacterized protein (AIM24 family)